MERINSVKKGTYNLFCRQGHLFKERYYYNLCESKYAGNMLPLSFRLTSFNGANTKRNARVIKQETRTYSTMFGMQQARRLRHVWYDKAFSFKLCDSRIMKDRSGVGCSFYGDNACHIDGFRLTCNIVRSEMTSGYGLNDRGWLLFSTSNIFRLVNVDKRSALYLDDRPSLRYNYTTTKFSTFRLSTEMARIDMRSYDNGLATSTLRGSGAYYAYNRIFKIVKHD